jgi:hypothetical protein
MWRPPHAHRIGREWRSQSHVSGADDVCSGFWYDGFGSARWTRRPRTAAIEGYPEERSFAGPTNSEIDFYRCEFSVAGARLVEPYP